MVKVLTGDIFSSNAQTITNTVNCVGVMGKGIALGFRQRYPEMYEDYVQRCDKGLVKLGRPYIYKQSRDPWILNFPTKDHWRQGANLDAILDGLGYLQSKYKEWGIESLAVPPLGSGLGGLEWRVVGPTLYRALRLLDIPVELYAPFGTPSLELSPDYLAVQPTLMDVSAPSKIEPGWIALVEIANTISGTAYHEKIGRVMFQKIAYFATKVGIETGLTFERGNYGPYSKPLKRIVNSLVNNGLIKERRVGRKFVQEPGRTYEDVLASTEYMDKLADWSAEIDKVVDLVLRIRTPRQAELAASILFASDELGKTRDSIPAERDIVDYVVQWKRNRKPFNYDRDETIQGVRMLQAFGWMVADPSPELEDSEYVEVT